MAQERNIIDVDVMFCPETPQTVFTRDLLRSGLFSDVEVHHGDDVFKCHRTLLCTRSEWFRDQLMDFSVDGELPDHVKIPDDFRREEVQFILESIYASSVMVIKYLGKCSLLEGIIRAWRLAHYFRIDDLEGLTVIALHGAIGHWYKLYSEHLRDEKLASLPASMFSDLVDGIKALYQDNRIDAHPTFKSPLLAIALCGIHTFRTDADIDTLLDSSPAFAADWARVLMHRWAEDAQLSNDLDSTDTNSTSDHGIVHSDESSPRTTRKNPACAWCHKQFNQTDSRPYPNLLKWAKKEVYEEMCWTCLPDCTVEEWKKA